MNEGHIASAPPPDGQHRPSHPFEGNAERRRNRGIAPGVEIVGSSDKARRFIRVRGGAGVVRVRLPAIGRQRFAGIGPSGLHIRDAGAKRAIGKMRGNQDHGSGKVLRKVTGRQSRGLGSSRRAHHRDPMRARTPFQPLRRCSKRFEWNAAKGGGQILVGEDSLCEGRMTVTCEQCRLILRQSTAGARNHNDGDLLRDASR